MCRSMLFCRNENYLILRSRRGGVTGVKGEEVFVYVDGEELEGVSVGGFDEDVSLGFIGERVGGI